MSDDRCTINTEHDTIEGRVVATRSVDNQNEEFARIVLNTLEFRGLEGGTYKLVKVSDETTQNKHEE